MERSPLRHRRHMVARRLGYWWRVLVAHGSWYPTRILTWQWVQIQRNHCDHIDDGAWVAPASYLMEHQATKKTGETRLSRIQPQKFIFESARPFEFESFWLAAAILKNQDG